MLGVKRLFVPCERILLKNNQLLVQLTSGSGRVEHQRVHRPYNYLIEVVKRLFSNTLGSSATNASIKKKIPVKKTQQLTKEATQSLQENMLILNSKNWIQTANLKLFINPSILQPYMFYMTNITKSLPFVFSKTQILLTIKLNELST